MLELTYFENSICAERPLTVLAEKGVTDGAPRRIHLLKGEQFDPADLELGTFIARLTLLEPWVGPSGEEAGSMGVEGAKVVDDFRRKRAEYAARYGMA